MASYLCRLLRVCTQSARGTSSCTTDWIFSSGFLNPERRKSFKPDYVCRRIIYYLLDRGAVPRSSTKLNDRPLRMEWFLLGHGIFWEIKNNHLRVVVVYCGVFCVLFIFGFCIIFLFRSYPYNMMPFRLCQHYFAKKIYEKTRRVDNHERQTFRTGEAAFFTHVRCIA